MALQGAHSASMIEYVSDLDPAKRTVREPIDPNDPAKGTKEVEVIDDDATVFLLGTLDVQTMARIFDNQQMTSYSADGSGALKMSLNTTAVEACIYGLKGWRNFLDANGQPIPFLTIKKFEHGKTYEKVSDETMNALGTELAFEIGTKLKNMASVTKVERKNSEPALSPAA